MDNRDLASGSCSEMRKKLKLDDHEEEEVDCSRPSPADPEKEAFNALARSFIRSGVNPNTIKTPSFTKLIRLLNPNFRPTVSILKNEVLEIHQECKEKAKSFLKSFQGKLTLSYEWIVLGHGWTRDSLKGPVLQEDFVCITAHFVDDDWKVRRWILGYAGEVDVVAMDDLYVHGFRKAVQGFEIEGKVSTLLLPNDEGFDEETLGGFRRGLEERGDSSIAPPVFLVYCCADLFRLMVHDVFRELSGKLLEDLRMIVGWGKCSSENWHLWVSNLQRAVDMKNEDEFSKDEIYDDYDKPSDEEWVKIETFSRLVGCMYKVAVELFEGGYSTSNVYFYLLAELKVMLEKELEGADSDYFRCNAKWMLKRFDKYWDHMFLVLATASVLDPRFKMKYLEFYCSKKIDNDEGSKAETVLDYLRSLYARYAASDVCQKPICSVVTVDSKEEGENDDGGGEEEDHDELQDGEEDYDDEQEGENEEDSDEELGEGEEDCEDDEEEEYDEEEDGEEKYDSDSSEEAEREARKNREKKPDACKDFAFFQEFLKFEGSSPRECGESELDAYLKEPVMEWNKDFKALDWWREEGHKYPVLSRVARDILSIPISRATSYHAYGMDRREPPAFVVSLEAEVANAMMCSKKWLRL
ncbi:zinc finger BED domain-containing protein RICESLEEPER 2 [Brassica rapa]|uniref:zinc finger BED domain-containing protein RICESLEEPER 2 n=1 Tax=Brassica campestris TaxID=3711 RepID=UPI00142E5CCB|nr:zinc finger BED domain-containing protein RICESLEEPER 2 [Brassica rapa]